MPDLGVVATEPEYRDRAEKIAADLAVKFYSADCSCDYQLVVGDDGLSVSRTGSNQKPLRVDFNTGSMTYRRIHSSRGNETIARAVGVGKKDNPVVVDATAGLGKDSFILAALGCSVIMLERSPVIALLLEDGLQRASDIVALKSTVARMQLQILDAQQWIESQESMRGYTVYMDPMFPSKSGSALSKGDMQLMQSIVGVDEEFNALFNSARASGVSRIVLKRPLRGAGLNLKPTFSLNGKASRFDVFINPA